MSKKNVHTLIKNTLLLKKLQSSPEPLLSHGSNIEIIDHRSPKQIQ